MLCFVHQHLQFGKLQMSFLSAVIKDEITLNLLVNICTGMQRLTAAENICIS